MDLGIFDSETCGGFCGGFPPMENRLKIGHQNFTTFFTQKFTISKEICHLVLTFGAISYFASSPEIFCEYVFRICLGIWY